MRRRARVNHVGSFATGQATEASDIELAVEYDTPIGLGSADLVEDLGRVST
jgi:predicted nucleotidyltransferase